MALFPPPRQEPREQRYLADTAKRGPSSTCGKLGPLQPASPLSPSACPVPPARRPAGPPARQPRLVAQSTWPQIRHAVAS